MLVSSDSPVTHDTYYTSLYTYGTIPYSVNYYDSDGNLLSTDTGYYGKTYYFNCELPEAKENYQYVYKDNYSSSYKNCATDAIVCYSPYGPLDITVYEAYCGSDFEFYSSGNLKSYIGSSTEIEIPAIAMVDNYAYDVTGVGSSFYENTELTKVTIPDSFTSVSRYDFYGCSSLAQVILPDSINYVENAAFKGCSSLSQINLPNSITFIGYSAFEGCSSLNQINYYLRWLKCIRRLS